MNWKLLGTMVTLIGVGASVALGQGTTPTIVQGDYISNVFGNSNFIKNPNAKLNNKDVTVSNATVTRSTTTPLVATSEFLVTTSTSTGSATWSTRTFDAGMKGQNCEARFSYRGFSVGSTTAQILQGANVVAQLTLTPSTDPRIASINFPCGDLSSATTFRLQQATASLTGTNEIGGIYVGLATNMANVAQAQFYGGIQGLTVTTNPTTTSATLSNLSGGVFTASLLGNVTSYDAATMSITFSSMPSGDYLVTSPLIFSGASTECRWSFYEDTSAQYAGDGYTTGQSLMQLSARFSFTATASRTFRLRAVRTAGTNACTTEILGGGGGGPVPGQFLVYRFPSSSELVVTPERQNVFGGVVYDNNNQLVFLGTPASGTFSEFNNAAWNQPTKLKGKAQVTTTGSGNDLGFSIPNLPVGSYRLQADGILSAEIGSTVAGNTVECIFRIRETTIGTTIASSLIKDSYSTSTSVRDYTNVFSGVFTNTSVGTRNFRIEAAKTVDQAAGNTSRCQAYSASTSYITFTLEPLDQPSNSALYVQGPVQAAATGAAIPAGYLGQTQLCSGSRGFVNNTNGAAGWSLNSSVSAGCTLTPGIYLVRWSFLLAATSGTSTGQKTAVLTTDSTDGWPPTSNLSQGNLAFGNGTLSGDDQRASTSIVTVTPSGISGGTGFVLYGKIFVTTHTSFTGTYYFDATIVRLN